MPMNLVLTAVCCAQVKFLMAHCPISYPFLLLLTLSPKLLLKELNDKILNHLRPEPLTLGCQAHLIIPCLKVQY